MKIPAFAFWPVLLFLAALCPAQTATEKSSPTERVDPGKGFDYPYYLYVPPALREPESAGKTFSVLVIPNNTGTGISDDLNDHEQDVKRKMVQAAFVFNQLNAAVLVPVFPRPKTDWKIYTHALDRDSLTTGKKEYKRFDLQLKAMIDDARSRLQDDKIKTDEKVLMYGFSASGMFVNRFTFLHPERVRAAAIGSPGGWPIAPVATFEKKNLRYPVGVADLKEVAGEELNLKELRKVPLFVFMGDKDDNDSLTYRDGYEEEDEKLVFELFGKTPVERWEMSRKLYQDQKLNATFKLYEGVAHTMSKEMREDILKFLTGHL
ncbi:MAG: hypothetical protein R2747_20530 [Pyrinomonadaceae bacterium]